MQGTDNVPIDFNYQKFSMYTRYRCVYATITKYIHPYIMMDKEKLSAEKSIFTKIICAVSLIPKHSRTSIILA